MNRLKLFHIIDLRRHSSGGASSERRAQGAAPTHRESIPGWALRGLGGEGAPTSGGLRAGPAKFLFGVVGGGLRGFGQQVDVEARALAVLRIDGKLTAMILDDREARGQA